MKIFLCGFFFWFSFVSNCFAQLPVGKVLNMSLTRNLVINGKKIKSEDKLYWGDKIETNSNEEAELLLFPSLTIKIKPNSEVAVVGNLISESHGKTNTESIIKVMKGSIVANLYKTENNENNLKVIGKRSISSIRGTIFEVNVDSENENTVFEGKISVTIPAIKKELEVNQNESLNTISGQSITNTAEIPKFIPKEEVESIWSKNSAEILSHHKKEAQKYKKLLDQESKKITANLDKSASGMFNNIRGVYGNKKK